MSDSFNPHEILSRLRASKPTGNVSASNGVQGNRSHQFSEIETGSGQAPPPLPHQRFDPSASMSSPTAMASATAGTNNSPGAASAASMPGLSPFGKSAAAVHKSIRGPLSMTLTPSQRQENLAARAELEREIALLQEEARQLRQENEQLRQDKLDAEQQLIEYKVKNDETVTKLRGKIAALNLQLAAALPPKPGAVDTKTTMSRTGGKIYGGSPPALRQLQQQNLYLTPHATFTHTPGNGGEGFRDPTFSELMRRSTPERHGFRESLRKPDPPPPPPPSHPHPHSQQHARHPHSSNSSNRGLVGPDGYSGESKGGGHPNGGAGAGGVQAQHRLLSHDMGELMHQQKQQQYQQQQYQQQQYQQQQYQQQQQQQYQQQQQQQYQQQQQPGQQQHFSHGSDYETSDLEDLPVVEIDLR